MNQTERGTRGTAHFRPSCLELESRVVPAVSIRFDYSFDTENFFSTAERRAALEQAAQQIAPHLNDHLQAIMPSGNNTWSKNFYDPKTNQTITINNPVIRQNEIVVYVSAMPLSRELGLSSSGGYTASGERAWLNQVASRGQEGSLSAVKTDYATWGGHITFNNRANWSFSTGQPEQNQFDFTSVALHELLHIFGFGLGEPAFTRHISNGWFQGPTLLTVNGGPVEVVGDPPDHFAPGTSFRGAESPMQPSLSPGVKRRVTPLEFAVLQDIGWEVSNASIGIQAPTDNPAPNTIAQPVVPAPSVNLSSGQFAVGTLNAAIVYGSSGDVLRSYQPFGPNYSGGIRVATADLNGDGAPDLIIGSGPGVSSRVLVVDGLNFNLLAVIQPFESLFGGGVHLATGDITGNGVDDLVVTPDNGGGPVVVAYDGASLAQGQVNQLNRFFGLNDTSYRGGLRPALGDVNGNGIADLVVSAGIGGGPRVAIIDGRTLTLSAPQNLAPDFFAFDPSLRNGAYVAVGDINGDGYADIIAGAGPGGGPRVTIFSGHAMLQGQQNRVVDFFAGDVNSRLGARVSVNQFEELTRPTLLVATTTSAVAYTPTTMPAGISLSLMLSINVPGFQAVDGLHVG